MGQPQFFSSTAKAGILSIQNETVSWFERCQLMDNKIPTLPNKKAGLSQRENSPA